jgi:hypothetical protein
VDYRPAVLAACQIPIMALSMVGKFTDNEAFSMDAATIQLNAAAIAEFAQGSATESESIAALLDKLMVVGPYGAGAVLILGIGAQIAANHKVIPTNNEMGILDRDGLAAALARQAAAAGG